MIRAAALGVFAVLLAGCAQTPSVPPASPLLSTQPPGSATPTLLASPSGMATDLAWSPLTGLDLRGAVVGQGAVSGPITVLLGADTRTGALVSWTSTDGAHWRRHWLDGSTFGGGMPRAVVAGGPGFVALGWNVTPKLDTELVVVWTSPDGVVWQPDPDPSGHMPTGAQGIASTGSSIVVATCCDTTGVSGRPFFRTSTNGITWVETRMPTADNAGVLHLAANASGYLATALVDEASAPDGRAPAAWRSTDGRTWVRDPAIDQGLRKPLTGVSDIQGSGDGFTIADDSGGYLRLGPDGSVAPIEPPARYGYPLGGPAGPAWLGTPDGGTCASAWVRAPDTWRAVLTDTRGCAGPTPASSPSLMIAFALRGLAQADGWLWVSPETGTSGETAWAIRPANSVPVVDPPAGPAPVPPTTAFPVVPTGPLKASAPCPAGPVTIAKIVATDANDRVACFGSRQLTFRAWVVDPGVGYGGACLQVNPTWLQECVLPDWLLASNRTGTGEIHGQLHALKRPDATGDLTGVSRWVDVTGHFDDPAAATCQVEAGPSPGEPPVAWFVLQCREQFVVTRISTRR